MTLEAFRASLGLLSTRRFGVFTLASLLSNIGTFAQQVAQPWLLLSLGASSFIVGLDSFAQGAPGWFLTLQGGVLADRRDRRRIIVTFQTIQMLCPVLLVALLLTGDVRPWIVVVVSAIVGITDALSMPSFQTIVPSIVPHDRISTGLALNATQFNLSRVIGPAIAGILISTVGAVGCFAINAASYLPFIAVAMWVLPRTVITATASVGPVPDGGARLFSGAREALRNRRTRGAILTVFASSLLCGPLLTFVPVLVRDAFHGAASQFSLSVGAFGVGGLLGAVGLLFVGPAADRRRWSSVFAIVLGAVLVLAALNPSFLVLPALLVVAGLSASVSNTSANTLAQSAAAPALRGQTVSIYMLALRGGTSLGALLTGAAVDGFGIRHALLIDGTLAIVVQLVLLRLWLRGANTTVAAAR